MEIWRRDNLDDPDLYAGFLAARQMLAIKGEE